MKNEERLVPSGSIFYKVTKRIFDIVFSLVALILLSPILLIISLLIILDDGFPVFFKQKRTGLNGSTFYIYKFRSMKVTNNGSNQKKVYDWKNGVPDDFIFKSTQGFDPNVTKIGRFIRKYSLDELPQFINVLKGEMSIIGPRPEITEITDCYNEYQKQRLLVKPGITGWAQVNGRSEIPHGEKIKYDLYYVANQGFVLDMKIFFKTIVQALFGKGAI
jgi:lipopolysaccharide/colanic/teichoic acid biosynthesis glycosyltransferase